MTEIQIDNLFLQEKRKLHNKEKYEQRFEKISKQKQEYYIANKERINERVKQRRLEKNGGEKKRGRPRKVVNGIEPQNIPPEQTDKPVG